MPRSVEPGHREAQKARRGVLANLARRTCVLLTLALAALFARAEPIPTEVFFQAPSFSQPKLSPNGKLIGALTRFDENHYALTLIDLEAHTASPLTKAPGMTVADFWWKTDDLLVLAIDDNFGWRAYRSIDLRSGKVVDLEPLQASNVTFLHDLPTDPEWMLFSAGDANTGIEVWRRNVRTGQSRLVERNPGGVTRWLTNRAGEIVGGWGQVDEKSFLLWRAAAGEKWQRIEQKKQGWPDWIPLAVANDPQRLIVCDYTTAATGRVVSLNPSTGAREDIFPAGDAEPAQVLWWGRAEEPAAVEYGPGQPRLRYLNRTAENFYRALASALPEGEFRCISFSADNRRVLIKNWSARNPGRYFLFDFATQELSPLSPAASAPVQAAMVTPRQFSFTSSDQLTITGSVTLPTEGGTPPVIVLLGPDFETETTASTFDPAAQFFANRGFAAVRIHHRGIPGLGRTFTEAGDYAFSTGIARDLREGVKWLGEQGWIDPKRAAILGTRRGSLVGLHAAAAGDFRALVNIGLPISPLKPKPRDLAYSGKSTAELTAKLGGPKDAETFLKSLSPLAAAEKLSIPSFHAYLSNTDGEFPWGLNQLEAASKKHGAKVILFTRVLNHRSAAIEDQRLIYDAAVDFLRHEL